MDFHIATPLTSLSLFSVVKEDTIFSMEASMAGNVGTPFLSAFAFLLLIGCLVVEADAEVISPLSACEVLGEVIV
jgi:hypothetical protein